MLDEKWWEPVSGRETAAVMGGAGVPWWIAGGWALDLFLGEQTRPHEDTDVLILRRDQLAVQAHVAGWDLYATKQPRLAPWTPGRFLEPPVNDIWARKGEGPWRFQLMLMETEGEDCVYRRLPAIRGPIAGLGLASADGTPYLRPEIQLLYKAGREYREKDLADFRSVLPRLGPAAREWLRGCLVRQFPAGHDWLAELGPV